MRRNPLSGGSAVVSTSPGGFPVGGAALTQATWYIDPTNGNDSNDGTANDAAHALKTHAELEARWGFGGRIAQITSVFIVGNMPASDPINVRVSLKAGVTLGYYAGPNTTYASGATSQQTGTITTATALARATNVPWQATDSAGGATWPTTYLGFRMRVTSGANSGMFFWVAKDLTGKNARVSAPATLAAGLTTTAVTIGAISNNDPYQIDQQITATLGEILVTQTTGTAGLGGLAGLAFQDFEFSSTSANDANFGTVGAYFRGCKFKAVFTGCGQSSGSGVTSAGVNFSNCCFDAVNYQQSVGYSRWEAGLIRETATNTGMLLGGGRANIDGDLLFQGGGALSVMSGSVVQIGTCGSYDAVVSSNTNPNGAGVYVGGWNSGKGGLVNLHTGAHATAALYGSGAAGAGIDIGAGATFAYQTALPPSIVGSTAGTNDFRLGSSTANARAFDDATGAATTIRANSWANLAATIAGGGFAGSAHNFQANAHIIVDAG